MANSKRKCKWCKKYHLTDSGVKVPAGFFCSMDHAVLFAQDKQAIARKRQITKSKQVQAKKSKEAKKAVRELNRRDLSWQHKQTQKSFNKLRVLQEKKWFADHNLESTCISCGKPNMDWCAGHFKSRGAQSGLRYDEFNVFLQCNRYCNMGLSGNIEGNKTTRGYKNGLLDRFGDDDGRAIIEYCETHSDPVKWTLEELEKMRSSFNKRIREFG